MSLKKSNWKFRITGIRRRVCEQQSCGDLQMTETKFSCHMHGTRFAIRTTGALLAVVRDYPEFPVGSRRWDKRIFHPHPPTGSALPLSAFWKAPLAYIEPAFTCIRLLDDVAVQLALRRLFRATVALNISPEISREAAS